MSALRPGSPPLLVATLLLPLMGACLSSHSGAGVGAAPAMNAGDYPGELIDSHALPDGIFWRQRIEARHGDHELSFQAIVQTSDGVLTVLALTPYGSRGFLLEQRGREVEFTAFVDRPLPFPPRFILLDVQRTFFQGLPADPGGDGTRAGVAGNERIEERWQEGRLLERSYERVDGAPPGRIRILYGDGMTGGVPPGRIELHNGWFDYRLVIQTLPQ